MIFSTTNRSIDPYYAAQRHVQSTEMNPPSPFFFYWNFKTFEELNVFSPISLNGYVLLYTVIESYSYSHAWISEIAPKNIYHSRLPFKFAQRVKEHTNTHARIYVDTIWCSNESLQFNLHAPIFDYGAFCFRTFFP